MELTKGGQVAIISPADASEIQGDITDIDDCYITITTNIKCNLKSGYEFLMLAYDKREIVEYYCKVVKVECTDLKILRPDVNPENKGEKRRFNRVPCSIGFIGSIAGNSSQFYGTVRNLSGGGIMMETGSEFSIGVVFNLKLRVNFVTYDCMAMVVRKKDAEGGSAYEYGCQFLKMPVEDVKKLSTFVFQEKLKSIRKEMFGTLKK
jgi:c-di-GMP-binding flagellar brake protein YcgR